jgi:hypothetical protein
MDLRFSSQTLFMHMSRPQQMMGTNLLASSWRIKKKRTRQACRDSCHFGQGVRSLRPPGCYGELRDALGTALQDFDPFGMAR